MTTLDARYAGTAGAPIGLGTSADYLPTAAGWEKAAVAVQSVVTSTVPAIVRITPAGYAPLLIDFRHRAYTSPTPLEDLPIAPLDLLVETAPTSADAPPVFALPGDDLDALLWTIGVTAFDERPATWLRAGDRYRLIRWPNFTIVVHHMDHIRMTALLSNGWLSVTELADAVDATPGEAQRLINAFSLMGVVAADQVDEAPKFVAMDEAAQSRSIFRRLRARLGI